MHDASAHDDADVTFAMDMIPHDQDAVEMAAMALEQARTRESWTWLEG